MGRKLKECNTTAKFELIDAWTHRLIAKLPADEALAIYGECEVEGGYTNGFVPEDEKGRYHYTAVWLKLPGMHLGIGNKNPITIFDPNGDRNQASFIGKKSGQLITVTRHGDDDYDAWFRSPEDRDNGLAGYSVRGTMNQIIDEIREEV